MRLVLCYILVFGLGIVAIWGMLAQTSRSERAISGVWKEVSWEYEKLHSSEDANITFDSSYTAELRDKVGHEIIYHENEQWVFKPNGDLVLQSNNGDSMKILQWNLKGRGDKLIIRDGAETVESYKLADINENRMVLNFEVDMQARGIAKLTFEKIR